MTQIRGAEECELLQRARTYLVIEITESHIVCSYQRLKKMIGIKTDDINFRFAVGDIISWVEHKFHDVYRKGKRVGGFSMGNYGDKMFYIEA